MVKFTVVLYLYPFLKPDCTRPADLSVNVIIDPDQATYTTWLGYNASCPAGFTLGGHDPNTLYYCTDGTPNDDYWDPASDSPFCKSRWPEMERGGCKQFKARCYRLAPWYLEEIIFLVIFAQIYSSETSFFRAPNARMSLPWEGTPTLPYLPPAQSSMLSSCPLVFGGNHILVIFAQNMHQKLFFQAENAKISLPWEGTPTLPDLPPARSAHSDFRNPVAPANVKRQHM